MTAPAPSRLRRGARAIGTPPRRLRLRIRNAAAAAALEAARAEALTYLEPSALLDLAEAMLAVERRRVPGAVVEAGTAYGGSALVLAAAKSAKRPLFLYDVFGAFPAPGSRDGTAAHERYSEMAAGRATWRDDKPFYGYVHDLEAEVRASLVRHGLDPAEHAIRLVPGLIEETLEIEGQVALAHVDCDWYEPVRACLERIGPRLSPGGRMILDDYDDWQGAREAVDEYLASNPEVRAERRSRLHLVRPDRR